MTRTGYVRLIVPIAAIGLLLASCSDDDGGSSTAASEQTTTTVSACAEADALRASVDELGAVDVQAEGTDGVTAAVDTVKDDLAAARVHSERRAAAGGRRGSGRHRPAGHGGRRLRHRWRRPGPRSGGNRDERVGCARRVARYRSVWLVALGGAGPPRPTGGIHAGCVTTSAVSWLKIDLSAPPGWTSISRSMTNERYGFWGVSKDNAIDLDAGHGSRVDWARWSSTTAHRRTPRRRLLYDHLDFMHGVQAFLGALRGASIAAVRRGLPVDGGGGQLVPVVLRADGLDVAVPDRQLRHRLLLGVHRPLGRADGDRRARPSAPRRGSSARSTTCGSAGSPTSACPARTAGEGGRYLIVGPGYDGPLPDSGYHVFHCPHDAGDLDRPRVHGRQRPDDPGRGDPQRRPGAPYVPGAHGTAVGSFLAGDAPLGAAARRPRPGSSRRRGCRSTRCSRTTSATGSWSTSWCSRSRPKPATPSCSACSPPSGSCTASRSSPTTGCARSSRTPSWSATPPPAP